MQKKQRKKRKQDTYLKQFQRRISNETHLTKNNNPEKNSHNSYKWLMLKTFVQLQGICLYLNNAVIKRRLYLLLLLLNFLPI